VVNVCGAGTGALRAFAQVTLPSAPGSIPTYAHTPGTPSVPTYIHTVLTKDLPTSVFDRYPFLTLGRGDPRVPAGRDV